MIVLKSSPIKVFKERVAKIKHLLPANWKEILISNYPKYNTLAGGNLMRNVYNLHTTHVELTEIMERIANGELKMNNENNKSTGNQ